MADLPTGTVTFLFTDIEGSTRLWEQHPQAMAGALARHDAIMRQAITAEVGMVYKVIGDAFQAAFTTAPAACAAALAAQRALGSAAWGVVGGDYRTGALNRLGRLLGAVHGGQIVLSQATADLARDTLPPDVTLRDLGARQLRDLRPEPVFQLIAPDLPREFPPLKTLDHRTHNLPAQPTPLIGREQALATVCGMLRRADVRLVTLTGPGGTGKTRLALQSTADLLEEFVDGVWFINLAPISDSSLVAATVAQTLGVREISGRPLLDQLKDYLREKQLLLLLDNFEQVVAAAPLVGELLSAAPALKLLVTSREPLHLSGEHEYAVPPLALPPTADRPFDTAQGRRPTTDDQSRDLAVGGQLSVVGQYAAVQLFLARAQAVKADFAVTDTSAPAIAAICRRLDGLPLAIELAAARVKLLPPQALLTQLGSRLKLLTGGARDLPERQQTIRAAIDWSHDLLNPAEQALFRRLGVFVGGWTLEAAEAVCAQGKGQKVKGNKDDNTVPVLPFTFSLLPLLAALLDKSLLKQAEGVAGEPRFTMLETIREYACEQLALSGELEDIEQRRADYYRSLAATAELGIRRSNQIGWLDRLEQEHDNLRAAIAWYHKQPNEVAGEMELTASLWTFFALRCHYDEGRMTYRTALARCNEHVAGTSAYALALVGAGFLAMLQGDKIHGLALGEASLAIWRQLGIHWGIALALNLIGSCADGLGQAERGVALLEESLTVSRAVDDPWCLSLVLGNLAAALIDHGNFARAKSLAGENMALGQNQGLEYPIAMASMHLGSCAWLAGDYNAARSYFEESLACHRRFGDRRQCGNALFGLGELARVQGDDTQAAACYAESLALAQEVGDKQLIAVLLYSMGYLALRQRDPALAAAHFAESLALAQVHAFKVVVVMGLIGFAAVACERRAPERAARLLGAAMRLRDTIELHLNSLDGAEYDQIVSATQAQLDEAAWATAWAAGRALSMEQAIAEAERALLKAEATVTVRQPGSPPRGNTTTPFSARKPR